MTLLIIIVVLILIFGVGGTTYGNGQYRSAGFGLGGVLVVLLILLLLTGNLHV